MKTIASGTISRCLAGLVILLSASRLDAVEFRPAEGGWGWTANSIAMWLKGITHATRQPQVRILKEPKYKNPPLYIKICPGDGIDGIFCGALDSSAPGAYDILHLDTNNNGDLTDDAVLELKHPAKGSNSVRQSEPVQLTIKYFSGTERKLRVVVMTYAPSDPNGPHYFNFHLADHMEGRIDMGDRRGVLVGLYDWIGGPHGANGCFADIGIDHIRIDLNGNGKLDGEKEDFLLGKVVGIDDKLWDVSADNEAGDVRISPCSLPAAQIQFKPQWTGSGRIGGKIRIAGMESQFFCDLAATARPVTVPEGVYQFNADSCVATGDEGKTWTFDFSTTTKIRVTAGAPVSVALGSPFKLTPQVSGTFKRGERIGVSARLTGAGGEEYRGFTLNGNRTPPHVRITNTQGTVAAEGDMEYG